MRKGFTLVEVSILLVIFLIVAFLVAPLSLDDTLQARHTSLWRGVQSDFSNIFHSHNYEFNNDNSDLQDKLESTLNSQIVGNQKKYRISFLNGAYPRQVYEFDDYKTTYSSASLGIKVLEEPIDDVIGFILYDVNGIKSPNIWGKDVFGYNIYKDRIEPFCREKSIEEQKQDCSKSGTGLCCSNYYLIGGSFD